MVKGKLTHRLGRVEDMLILQQWLNDDTVMCWMPMCNEKEVDEAIRSWTAHVALETVLAVECDGVLRGIVNLYVNSFQKLQHQALFCIVVDKECRGQGVGTYLLERLFEYARERFHIEILHLEVYEGNPAIHLYERLGFVEYARHQHFIWEQGRYCTRIMMEKILS